MKRPRLKLVIPAVAGVLVLLLGGAFVLAWTQLRGSTLSNAITDGNWLLGDGVNDDARGRLIIERIDWPPVAVLDFFVGIPVRNGHAAGVRVVDPRGQDALQIPDATANVKVWPIILHNQVQVRGARVPRAVLRLEAIPTSVPGETELGLVAAMSSKKPPTDERGLAVDVRDLQIKSLDFYIRQPDWTVTLQRAHVAADILHDGGQPAKEGLGLRIEAIKPLNGTFELFGKTFELQQVHVAELGTRANDRTTFRAVLEGGMSGARFHLSGVLAGFFGDAATADVTLEVENAAPLLNRLVPNTFAGHPHGTIRITGPLADPKIEIGVEDIAFREPVPGLEGPLTVHATIYRKMIEVHGLSGRFLGAPAVATGRIDIEAGTFTAELDLPGADPASLVAPLGGKLDAAVKGEGTLDPFVFKGSATMALERRRGDTWPRLLQGKGKFVVRPDRLDLDAFTIQAAGATTVVDGRINLARKTLALQTTVNAARPGRIVKVLEEGRNLHAELTWEGTFDAPQMHGEVTMQSLRIGPLAATDIRGSATFDGEQLRIEPIVGKAGGGTVEARLRVGPVGDAATIELQGAAHAVGLQSLLGWQQAAGTVDGTFKIEGPVDNPHGVIEAKAPQAKLLGYPFTIDGRLELRDDQLRIVQMEARQAAGGKLVMEGSINLETDNLDVTLKADDVALNQVVGDKSAAGRLKGSVSLSGLPTERLIRGSLDVSDLVYGNVRLGNAQLSVDPGADATHVRGTFFDGKATLNGYLTTEPIPMLSGELRLQRLDVAAVAPDLQRKGIMEAPVSGRISFTWNAKQGLSDADALITLRVTLYEREGLAEKVEIRSRGPAHIVWRDGRATIDPSEFVSPAGSLDISGWMEKSRSDLAVRGNLQLQAMQVFLRRWLDSIQGEARVDVRVTGPPTKPELSGILEFRSAFVVPRDVEKAFYLSQGKLDIAPDGISVERMLIQFGEATVELNGRLGLNNFRPTTLDASLRGDLAAEVLEVLLPDQIGTATGLLRVNLAAKGPVRSPIINGEITPINVELYPRGLGRTLDLTGGKLLLNNQNVTFDHIAGRIDEGEIVLDGSVELSQWKPVRGSVHIQGVNVPHRVPDQYDAEVNLDLRLSGSREGLTLVGQVDLVEARFIQEFDVTKLILKPRIKEERPPFWAGIPLLESMHLNLNVASTGTSAVKNNIAEIELDTHLQVTGTPANPRLNGEIRAREGRFKVPIMEGSYTIDRGSIVFDRDEPILDARVDLSGETIVEDIAGTEHTIRLTLQGTLREFTATFSSASGLDQGQIVTLLATGRTTEQLRAETRGEEIQGQGGTAVGPHGSPVDESLKQLTGDLFAELLDPVARAFHLDTARLEFGAQTIAFTACKRFGGQRVESCFETDQYTIGGSRAELRGRLRLDNTFSLESKYEQINQGQDTHQEDLSRLRFQLLSRWILR